MLINVSSIGMSYIQTYTCFNGYKLVGSSRRTCLYRWLGTDPVCQLGKQAVCLPS